MKWAGLKNPKNLGDSAEFDLLLSFVEENQLDRESEFYNIKLADGSNNEYFL